MDDLQTGRRGLHRERDDSSVNQGGIEAEGFAVLIVGRAEEPGGEDDRRAVGQTAEVGRVAGNGDRAGSILDVQRVACRGDGDVAGDVAVGRVVNQCGHTACDDVHGGGIGGAMEGEELDVPAATGFLGTGLDEEPEAGGTAVGIALEVGRVEDAVGDSDIGLAVGKRELEVLQGVGRGGAAAACDADVDGRAGRSINERRGRAEREVVQQKPPSR